MREGKRAAVRVCFQLRTSRLSGFRQRLSANDHSDHHCCHLEEQGYSKGEGPNASKPFGAVISNRSARKLDRNPEAEEGKRDDHPSDEGKYVTSNSRLPSKNEKTYEKPYSACQKRHFSTPRRPHSDGRLLTLHLPLFPFRQPRLAQALVRVDCLAL